MNPWKIFSACETLRNSPYFDTEYYSRRYHIPKCLCVLYDLTIGRKKEHSPSLFFNAHQYYTDNPDVKAAGYNALYHYLIFGERENRFVSGEAVCADCQFYYFFESVWYVATYMDKNERRTTSPLEHYLTIGWKKKHLPFSNFDIDRFYRDNPDCREEPLRYWCEHQLPTGYFVRHVYTEEGFTCDQQRALQHLYHFQQRHWMEKCKNARSLDHLTVVYVSDVTSLEDMSLLHRVYKEYAKRPQHIVAVMMPGRNEYFGEDIFPEGLRILNYSVVASHYKPKSLEIILLPPCVDQVVGYLSSNPSELILFASEVRFTLINTVLSGELTMRLSAYTQIENIQTRYIYQPHIFENPYYGFFDKEWYEKAYAEEIKFRKMDAMNHYLHIGWREGYLPFELFDSERFYQENPECDTEPLYYWFFHKLPVMYFTKKAIPTTDLRQHAGGAMQCLYKTIQNETIENVLPYRNTCKKLLVLMVSPEDAISGGIMSFCGLYRLFKELHDIHGRQVIAVSIPGETTHSGFTMFKNDMPVFRYEQLQSRLNTVEDILVMLPELYAKDYLMYLREHPTDMVLNVGKRHLNLLNQQVELMPERKTIDQLKMMFSSVTQTAAHYKYCSKEDRERFGIPVHLLLPPILKEFQPRPYEEKEKMFLYSYDEKPWKQALLNRIACAFPDMQLKEIRNIGFDEYLELIGRAKWCMTFGEGLDGYFSEPYESGSISFAVWNDIYFTPIYKSLPTILPNPQYALDHIVDKMRELDNKEAYEKTVNEVRRVHDIEYAGKRTSRDQLCDFFQGHYDFP